MYKVDVIGGHGMLIVEDHGNLVEWKRVLGKLPDYVYMIN